MQSNDNIPLSEPTFLILLSLAPGPQHGYAILKAVQTLSGGRVRLSTGTLYGAIKRLLGDGWIRRYENDDPPDPRGKKEYILTEQGRRTLNAEVSRMEILVNRARNPTPNRTDQ